MAAAAVAADAAAAAAAVQPAAEDAAAPAFARRGHVAPPKPALPPSSASLALASPVGFLAPLISLLPPASLATFRTLNKAARDHVAAHAFEAPLFSVTPKVLPSWHAACPSAVAVKLDPTASWKSLKPSELAALKAHTVLDMSGCVSLPGSVLARLTSLTALNASNCPQLSDDAFSYLKDLVSLDVSGCAQLSDDALKALKGARGLRELDISGCTQVTAAGLKALSAERLAHRTALKAAGCTGLAADAAPLLLKCTRARTLLLTRCSLPLLVATIAAAPPGSRLAVAATLALTSLPLSLDVSAAAGHGAARRKPAATVAAAAATDEDGAASESEEDSGGAAASAGGYEDAGISNGGTTGVLSSSRAHARGRRPATADASGPPTLSSLFAAAAPHAASSAPLAVAVARLLASSLKAAPPAAATVGRPVVDSQRLLYCCTAHRIGRVAAAAGGGHAGAAVSAFLASGGLHFLQAAVDAHPDSAPLAEEAAVILFSVAKASPAALEAAIASGGMTTLARLLNTHALPPALRSSVCDWLRAQAAGFPPLKAAIAAAGGVEGVVWVKPPVEHDVPRFGPPYSLAEDVFSLPIGALRPLLACFSTPETDELRLVSTDVQAHVAGYPWADTSTVVDSLPAWRTAFPRAIGIRLAHASDLQQTTYLEGITHLSLYDASFEASPGRPAVAPASIWGHVAALKSLVFLDVSHCDISGLTEAHLTALAPTLKGLSAVSVTGAGGLRLAPLTRLTHLSLYGAAGLTDAALTGLRALQELNIAATHLAGTALPELAPTLRVLKASNCQLTDAVLSTLTRLEEVDVGHNTNLTDAGLAPLGALHTVKAAYLRRLTDAAFAGKPKLHTVDITGCTQLTDAAFAAFGSVTDLTMTSVNTPAVTNAAFTHLGSLRRLVMRMCNQVAITDEGLSQCTNLQELNAANCTQPGFTGACFAAMPHLTKLDISGCYQLGDAALASLGPALRELDISGVAGQRVARSFTDAGFAHLPRLVTLRMGNCTFGAGFTAAAFSHLKALRVLHASNVAQLTDDALKALRGRLWELDMSGCTNVSGGALKYLAGIGILNMQGCSSSIRPISFKHLVGVVQLTTRTGVQLIEPTYEEITGSSTLPRPRRARSGWRRWRHRWWF